MMSAIYAQLRADIVTAMKARNQATTTALRTADAAIKRAAMDTNQEIDDALTITVLRKAVKNLTDAREEFAKGGRADLVAANDAEIILLAKYLPQSLSPDQLAAVVSEAIQTAGATTKKETGKVMAVLKQRPDAGTIDFGAASKLIQAKLA
ncbi:GatB/YqeY domain-containing protein [Horticoccus luteus]|uniref:GatB/YqeY domain-containing protein n=2 Tax=Horticoccus luteus TaxID=2862869 RepID=A0A8F9TX80_9BACT|nr:GatB/YqeY domain-containing protein [Horticoccus luteus]